MKTLLFLSFLIIVIACNQPRSGTQASTDDQAVRVVSLTAPQGRAAAAFAEGCFWCAEEIFEAVAGVDSAVSGYAGGSSANPTYETVSDGGTGHAESVLVYYDPAVISYTELLRVFFASQDPTTPNQQGPDKGTQYRSVIFYQNPTEKTQAEAAIKEAETSKKFSAPIITEVLPLKTFYRAENYHQDYVHRHPDDSYVVNVSQPRFELFKKTYPGKLKGPAQ
jgi:peptide-methionine (S)-S-oxide reductase